MHYYTLAGHLIASFDGTNTIYYLTDSQGTLLLSFSQSAILGEQIYGPYGNQRYTAGTLNTAKGYTGQIQDAVTGLDYYNARYYDPVVGVFLSVDSVQGNMEGFDPYAYVSGNPETINDPSGHCGVWCLGTVMVVTSIINPFAALGGIAAIRGATASGGSVTGDSLLHSWTVGALVGEGAYLTIAGAVLTGGAFPVGVSSIGVAIAGIGVASGAFSQLDPPDFDWMANGVVNGIDNGINALDSAGFFNAIGNGINVAGNWLQDTWNNLMSPSVSNAAELTPEQQVEYQEQQTDQEGANYFHMPLKKYQAWSHKEAVQAAKDIDTF